MTDHIADFFAFARERHAIYLRRRASLPRPWTTDPILGQYRFTNVFRQLDRTTQWYTENVRKRVPLEQILLATVVFRWFNRIATGEAIFKQTDVFISGGTAWDKLDKYSDREFVYGLKQAITAYCESGPYVTGAYIIKTPDGLSKLDGVLQCIKWFMEQSHHLPGSATGPYNYEEITEMLLNPESSFSLFAVWSWLRQFPFMGDFMAYEVVTDLRWSLLQRAPDIMTWANPGPGATRGVGRVFHGERDRYNQHRDKDATLIPAMRILLDASRDAAFWPQPTGVDEYLCGKYQVESVKTGSWPSWEMRDVEHTLCEFDKYERARTGEGRPRGTYR